jgi:hypothetical protein
MQRKTKLILLGVAAAALPAVAAAATYTWPDQKFGSPSLAPSPTNPLDNDARFLLHATPDLWTKNPTTTM